ncbi:CapA family protein [Patescibacteria group bacterium]
MKKAPFEIAVYILGAFLVGVLFIFGSYMKDINANIFETVTPLFESTKFVGAIVYEHDLDKFLNFQLIEGGEKPLVEARSLKGSEFVVAAVRPSRDDATFNAIYETTLDRVVQNFEFERVKYLAVENPNEIKKALYYFDLIGAHNVQKIDGAYYFKKGPKQEVENVVTLLGFGDVMLGRYVRTLMDANGMDYPFRNVGQLRGTDFVHANLEGPIKEVRVHTGKAIEFRFKPDIVWPLKESGINIVSIANNHALDQGWTGREDTKKHLNIAGVRYFGHPKNEIEDNAYITEVSGKKFAFVGFDDVVYKINGDEARELIARLDGEVDYVVVSVHWGVEYVHTPTTRKVNFAHDWIDNGADLIIGHHPHVVQTMEVYNGVPIFYSLGNFVFDQYWSGDTQEGMGFGVEISDDGYVVYLYPYKLPNSQPEFMVGQARQAFLDKFISWGAYHEELAAQIRDGRLVVERN